MTGVDGEKERVGEVVDTFSKGVFYHMGSFGISKIVGIAFTIIMLNYFASEESDLFFTANAFVSTISTMAGLGLSVAAIKFLPGMILRKEGGKIKTEVLSAVVLLAIAMVLVYAAAWLLPQIFGELGKTFEEMSGIIAIVFVLSFFVLETAYLSSVLNAFKQFFTTSMVNTIVQTLRLAVALVLIYVGLERAFEMLTGYMISYIVVALYIAWAAWNKISKMQGEAKIDFFKLEKSIKFGLPLYVSGIIDTFVTQMDVILVAFFLGGNPGIVSGYTAVVLIVRNIAPMVVAPIITVQQPILVEENERKSEIFLKIIREVSRWTFYFGLPVLLVFLAFDVAFMQIIASEYVANSYLIWLFVPFVMMTLLGISFRNSLMARGHVMTLFSISMVVILINLGLDVWLIPAIGVAGAAIGSSTAIFVGESAIVFFANRKFGALPHTDIFKALFAFLASLGLAFVDLPYFGQLALYSRGGILKLVISMAIVCSAYLVILFALKGFVKRDFDMGLKFLDRNGQAWAVKLLKPLFLVIEKYTG